MERVMFFKKVAQSEEIESLMDVEGGVSVRVKRRKREYRWA